MWASSRLAAEHFVPRARLTSFSRPRARTSFEKRSVTALFRLMSVRPMGRELGCREPWRTIRGGPALLFTAWFARRELTASRIPVNGQ